MESVNKLFQVHMLNDAGKLKAQGMATAFSDLANLLDEVVKNGDQRCAALMRTHLETACFYAKKSMASNTENTM